MEKKEIRPIDEISTPDLINELMNRCNPAVFIGNGVETCYYNYSGNIATCYGLCHELAFELLQRSKENGNT